MVELADKAQGSIPFPALPSDELERLLGEIALDVKVSPTMDAGAVLLVGDVGRVVLDPRITWLSDAEHAVRLRLDAGELQTADEAHTYLRGLLEPVSYTHLTLP